MAHINIVTLYKGRKDGLCPTCFKPALHAFDVYQLSETGVIGPIAHVTGCVDCRKIIKTSKEGRTPHGR